MRAYDRDLIRGGHYGQRPRVPHLKAEHMAAPTNSANVKKILANPEPSTHGTKRTFAAPPHFGRFSNRPSGVKHFQAIHHCSVDVAHGLALLFGIGTRALPSWESRTRRNNLLGGLTVRRSAPLRRASPASSRLRTLISRRSDRSRPIDTWTVSVQTPPRPPWSAGSGPARRRWRDRSARLRGRHRGPSSSAGTRHHPGRWPASGGARYRSARAAPAEQRAAVRPERPSQGGSRPAP